MYLSRSYVLIKLLWMLLSTYVECGRQKRNKAQDDYKPPEILESPIYYKVRLNDTVCLPCKFKTQYTGEYTILSYWQKNKTPVLSWPRFTAKRDCLEIRNIRSVDHGQYGCVALNQLGKTSAIRILTVVDRDPHTILEPQSTITPLTKIPNLRTFPNPFTGYIRVSTRLVKKYVVIGKRIKLRCQIKGSPSPKIYWLRNGAVVERSSKFSPRPRKKLLVIKNYTKHEVGRYTCVGKNSHGVRNMTFIVETKEEVQPATTRPLPVVKEITAHPGQNITLSCQAPAGKTSNLLSWNNKYNRRRARQQDSRQELALSKSTQKNGTYIQQYLLINISKSVHEGEYQCIGLFNKKVVKVKVVKLKVVERTVLPSKITSVSDPPRPEAAFPLKIVLPAAGVAFFLLVIFMCICFICSRKARRAKGMLHTMSASPQQFTESEEDPASMQVLPLCNYDSLRKHKPKSEKRAGSITSNNSCHFNTYNEQCTESLRSNNSCPLKNEITVIRNSTDTDIKTLNKSTSCKAASTSRSNSIASSIELNSCKNAPNRTSVELNCDEDPMMRDDNIKLSTIHYTRPWPGEKLLPHNPDYAECIDEKDRLLSSDYPTIEKTKKHHSINDKPKSISSGNETIQMSDMYKNNNCLPIKPNSRPQSTTSEEYELLKREHREPYLRHSTIVANDSGIDDDGVSTVAV